MGSDDRRNGIRNGMVIFAGTENENENAECGMTVQPERNKYARHNDDSPFGSH